MSNINTVAFTGRITHNPEVKQTTTGKKVCSFSIACERGWGEKKKVIFPSLVAWNGQAEFISKLPKGTMIAVRATYDEHLFEDKDGNKRKVCEFIADEIQAMESKRTSTDEQPPQHSSQQPDFEEISSDDELPF